MATKLSAATLIEGNISDEGLAALGSNDDLAAQLARELAQGISEHVEDLTAMFHKMAFLKENEQADEPTILTVRRSPESRCHPLYSLPASSATHCLYQMKEAYSVTRSLRPRHPEKM